MINSLSVIVPVLNKENEIIRTLESIDASIAFFHQHYDGNQDVHSELIVVDEGSTDRTPALLAEFGQSKPYFKVIKHFRSLGIGPARNTGVKLAQGEILFFCDGDDLFFKEHISLCFTLLNHQPNPAENVSQAFEITVGDRSYPLTLPPHPVGIVRTGVQMNDALHPYWKAAIENTLALNLCIRRDCHEFIEGFPEAPVYKQIGGCEDVSYDLWMAKFFKVLKVEIETVEYIRYPGNNFDRQLKKFQTAPDRYQDKTSPDETALHLLRRQLEHDRFSYLTEKFKRVSWNAAFVPILNWQQLAGDYLAQDCYAEAISLYEQGIVAEPDTRESVRNMLAAAYNNFGSAFHKQGDLEHAGLYFKKAIELNPTLAHSDFARVHFNLGTVRHKQKQFEQAILYLRKAVALQPDFSEAIAELSVVNNQFQLLTKGYQFSSSFADGDLTSLTSYLSRFQPIKLNALALGSGDGRVTCWLLDNILLQAASKITCVAGLSDGKPVLERFEANIARTGTADKVIKLAGNPRDVLRSQPYHSYQCIYVGGMTTASETLEIAVLSWGLLTVGGVMVFADYAVQPASMTDLPPKSAIEPFMTLFGNKLKRLYQGNAVLLEKLMA
jgi:glycosyltransferase involved in cell wall biosynthesis